MDSIISYIVSAGATGLVAVVAVTFIMRYLQRGVIESSLTRKELEMLKHELKATQQYSLRRPEELEQWVHSVKEEISQLKDNVAHLGDSERAEIIEKLKQRLESETAVNVLAEIEKKAAEMLARDSRDEAINSNFEQTIGRLREELFSLGKRSNLNLSLGIVTTITGLSILGVFVLSETSEMNEMLDFVKHFVPRISLVVFIEIFAYFFLRLYKETLSEIKYFQNEITNIEAKYLAAKMAVSSNNDENIKGVIGELSKTERNHVLNKGQTTVDIEKARIEQQTSSTVIEKLTSIIQKKS